MRNVYGGRAALRLQRFRASSPVGREGATTISPLGFLKNVLHELCNKIIQNGIIYTIARKKFFIGF